MDRKILVVDDDVAIHKVLVQHLSNSHTEVWLAHNGHTGLEMAKSCKPDLILLDVDMPDISGHEVCRRLKFDPQTKGIPITFLTAAATAVDRIVGLDQGAIDYIAKPFDPFEVAARTRAAFRTRSLIEMAGANTLLDNLTGLGNRPAFEQHLKAELARALRSAQPVVCLLIEPDRLDEIKEQQGHAVVDAIIADIATILKDACREEDRIFRYTDRQFAIIAPNVAVADMAGLGDRLHWAIETHPSLRRHTITRITIKIGLAMSRNSLGYAVVSEAAEALLQAKSANNGSVISAGELVELHLAN